MTKLEKQQIKALLKHILQANSENRICLINVSINPIYDDFDIRKQISKNYIIDVIISDTKND